MCHIILLLPIFALPVFWFLPLEQALVLYGGVCLLSVAFYWLLWRTMHQPATTGVEGMIGDTGTVSNFTDGKIKVFYKGEIWDAVSKDKMSLGETVKILGLEGMKLIVRRQV